MDSTNLQRVEADAPNRCQAITNMGQCVLAIKPGLKRHCAVHAHYEQADINQANRLYNLTKYKERVDQVADHHEVKSLREEIGITRILLERIWNTCEDDTDLQINAGRISDLVTKIEKLVTSCQRLEERRGMLLDKSAVLQFANLVVKVLGDHISDSALLGIIADKIVAELDLIQGISSDKALEKL